MNKKWTNEEEEILKKLCKENKTIEIIKSFINKSSNSISSKIKRLKLTFNSMKRDWSNEELNYLKKYYYYGEKDILIKKLKRSWNSIKAMATKLNLKMKDELNLKIPKNRFLNLLDNTCDAFYWMGFLMADGCFSPDVCTLSLEISKKDEYHLDKFISFLHFGKKQYRRDTVCVSGSDYINIQLICKKFDIKNNKTKNPPNIIIFDKFEKDLLFSLLIGFIDGDGNIRKSNKKYLQITVENYKYWDNFHIMLEKFFYNYFDLYAEYKNHQRYNIRNYSCLTICNKNLILKIKNKIEELKLPILARKWDVITNQHQQPPTLMKLEQT
jgi:hypothetical protein